MSARGAALELLTELRGTPGVTVTAGQHACMDSVVAAGPRGGLLVWVRDVEGAVRYGLDDPGQDTVHWTEGTTAEVAGMVRRGVGVPA